MHVDLALFMVIHRKREEEKEKHPSGLEKAKGIQREA